MITRVASVLVGLTLTLCLFSSEALAGSVPDIAGTWLDSEGNRYELIQIDQDLLVHSPDLGLLGIGSIDSDIEHEWVVGIHVMHWDPLLGQPMVYFLSAQVDRTHLYPWSMSFNGGFVLRRVPKFTAFIPPLIPAATPVQLPGPLPAGR